MTPAPTKTTIRNVNGTAVAAFLAMFIPAVACAIWLSSTITDLLPLGEYHAIATVFLSIVMIIATNILVYRIFLCFFPLKEGQYEEGSREEFTYNVYLLFWLVMFNSLLPSILIPVPLMRHIYIALGAKLGKETYCSGVIYDPILVTVGSNTIIGFDSFICPHALEGHKMAFYPVKIGDNVTIGMKSVIMAGTTIGDRSIIAAGSILTKGTIVGPDELWAGAPARLRRKLTDDAETMPSSDSE